MTPLLMGTLGLMAASAVSWIILLGGVGSLQSLYSDALEALGEESEDWIDDQLGLAWWLVWFHFLLLVAFAVSTHMGYLKDLSEAFGKFFTALMALQMYMTHEAAVVNRRAKHGEIDNFKSRAGAFLAGAMLSTFVSILLVAWLGALRLFEALLGSGDISLQKQGVPLPSGPSDVPPYVTQAEAASNDTPVATGAATGGYAPHHPPGMPPLPPPQPLKPGSWATAAQTPTQAGGHTLHTGSRHTPHEAGQAAPMVAPPRGDRYGLDSSF